MIVVAIIAILAAIAIPNFLAAQVRAKATRAKKELQTLSTALESYAVDYNCYPISAPGNFRQIGWSKLTTPIAFIRSIPTDEFKYRGAWYGTGGNYWSWYWGYTDSIDNPTVPTNPPSAYTIWSLGPDLVDQIPEYRTRTQLENELDNPYPVPLAAPLSSRYQGGSYNYDPTNGTQSLGDIWRASK